MAAGRVRTRAIRKTSLPWPAIARRTLGNRGGVRGSCRIDPVCAFGDRIFGKPGDAAGAVAQLQALQGQEHRLITAVAVAHRGQFERFTDVATLRMRELASDEIQRYVAAEQPFDCAGSYRIESLGIVLFEQIHCHDHTAIVGLPLLQLCAVLRRFGLAIP